jgi:hypothetical protein
MNFILLQLLRKGIFKIETNILISKLYILA